jgi:hypothetical protein
MLNFYLPFCVCVVMCVSFFAVFLLQRRWFKLSTRETMDPEHPYVYSFMWFKKEGGAVIKSMDIEKIDCISVLSSNRALSYLPLKQTLALQHEAANQPCMMVVKVHDPEAGPSAQPNTAVGSAQDEWVTFRILQKDGKEHCLRGAKVDRVIKWINTLSLVRAKMFAAVCCCCFVVSAKFSFICFIFLSFLAHSHLSLFFCK